MKLVKNKCDGRDDYVGFWTQMAEEFLSFFFLMKARFFDGVMKIYCAQMSEAWNQKNKKYIPCVLNKTKRGQRDQWREDEQQTTSNVLFGQQPVSRVLRCCERNEEPRTLRSGDCGGGGNAHHPEILEAAVQSAGLCSLFPANYNVIGAWANRALGAPLKLSDGLGLEEQHRCRSSSGTNNICKHLIGPNSGLQPSRRLG